MKMLDNLRVTYQLMMAELVGKDDTEVGGVMAFKLYCYLEGSLIYYIKGSL